MVHAALPVVLGVQGHRLALLSSLNVRHKKVLGGLVVCLVQITFGSIEGGLRSRSEIYPSPLLGRDFFSLAADA